MLVLWGPTWAELMVDDMVSYRLVFFPQMVVKNKGKSSQNALNSSLGIVVICSESYQKDLQSLVGLMNYL